MNIIKIILSTFVILSCSEKQAWQEVESGKTIKVFSQGFQVNNSNYIYKWSKPIGPNGSQSDYKIEHDKLLFTPVTLGEYYIVLEIENMMQTKVYEESFYFNVIKGNSKLVNNSTISALQKRVDLNENLEIALENQFILSIAFPTKIIKIKYYYFVLF